MLFIRGFDTQNSTIQEEISFISFSNYVKGISYPDQTSQQYVHYTVHVNTRSAYPCVKSEHKHEHKHAIFEELHKKTAFIKSVTGDDNFLVSTIRIRSDKNVRN